MRIFLTLLLALVVGCSPPKPAEPPGPPKFLSIDWQPNTARLPERSAEMARIIYKGDLDAVVVSDGSRILGTLVVEFPDKDSADVWIEKIQRSSAKRGGTHALVAVDRVTSTEEKSVDEDALAVQAFAQAMEGVGAALQGKEATDRLEMRRAIRGPRPTPIKTTVKTKRVVAVVLIYVPQDAWHKIPKELRPVAVKKDDEDSD